jgi:hypothetical protein
VLLAVSCSLIVCFGAPIRGDQYRKLHTGARKASAARSVPCHPALFVCLLVHVGSFVGVVLYPLSSFHPAFICIDHYPSSVNVLFVLVQPIFILYSSSCQGHSVSKHKYSTSKKHKSKANKNKSTTSSESGRSIRLVNHALFHPNITHT